MKEERMLRLTYEQENRCLSESHGFSKVMQERGLLAFSDFELAPPKDWRPWCFQAADEQATHGNLCGAFQSGAQCELCPYREREA